MSHPLVSHSTDLTQLEADGYDIDVLDNNLVVRHVPYVAADRAVAYGTLVSELSTNGTSTIAPRSHEIWFVGSFPCNQHGAELALVINQRTSMNFGEGLVASCSFSQKPPSGVYQNHYDKVTTYVRILGGYAKAIDPMATARTYPPHKTTIDESVFRYLDSASSRAGLSAVSAKLKLHRLAIVGLGGTGAYILDLVAKTPVGELHVYDDDTLFAHNAFRTPGAASLEELAEMPRKVDYLLSRYDPIRRGVIAHPVKIDRTNVEDLRTMDFVFVAIDNGPARKLILEALESFGVPYVDSGMGLYRVEDSLGGIARVTAGSADRWSHAPGRVPFGDENDDEYDWNIQTADLNMLNAAMAVIKWKKLFGYYLDRKGEQHSTYTVARNQLVSSEVPE
jgi:hypothetical protein